MKLVLIRHGDPIYSTDTLTEKGEVEASLLAKKLKGEEMSFVYSSPLGRALRTCTVCSEAIGFPFEVLPWLEEFPTRIFNPHKHRRSIIWDLMPSYFTKHPLLYDADRWMEDVIFSGTDVEEKFNRVKEGLSELLLRHGYQLDGKLIRVNQPNTDTVVLFCHFGVMSVIMSILSGFSPYVYFQHFCALTSSVTTLVTEEREKGIASFRCISYSDVSHLVSENHSPSMAGRFRETEFSEGRE